jgi:SAM-dependent methyltransferase
MDLTNIYRTRFSKAEREKKRILWGILIRSFLKNYIDRRSTVVDIGAGTCEFINQIACDRKIAVDLDPAAASYAAQDVKIIQSPADHIALEDSQADVVFASNFFEHLESKQALFGVIKEMKRILRPGGRAVILQPNIRYAYREYWDFCDHNLPLSDRSMTESLCINGFEIVTVIPRFLPFTTKSSVSHLTLLLEIYLRVPLLWRVFGKQFFIVAKKP